MNELIYERLKMTAAARGTTVYGELGPLIGLDMDLPAARTQLGNLLGEISTFEHKHGRPLLSVIVVHKKEDQMPGSGFFTLAKRLGIYEGKDNLGFFVKELKRVHEHWSSTTQVPRGSTRA